MVEHKLLPYSSGLEDFLATVARPTQPRAAVYLSVNLSQPYMPICDQPRVPHSRDADGSLTADREVDMVRTLKNL